MPPKHAKQFAAPFTLEQADKLQNELRRAYETPEFQEKLENLLQTTPDYKERMKKFKELIWIEQGPILPRYGFEATERGNMAMLVTLAPFNANPAVIRTVTRLNKALRLDELSAGMARFTESCQNGSKSAQANIQSSMKEMSTTASQNMYVECVAGSNSLPVLVSAPHDGRMCPMSIPDRVGFGTWKNDTRSLELSRAIHAAFPEDLRPALVINKLARKKLDANRPCCDGVALNNPEGFAAWAHYHNTLSKELRRTVRRHGFALLLDIHGQGHRKATELGYLLTSKDLLLSDAELSKRPSSVDDIVQRTPGTGVLAELVRGGASVGALLEKRGFHCTPSPSAPQPVPEADMRDAENRGVAPPTFYSGNYTARRYGGRPDTLGEADNPLTEDDHRTWASKVSVIQLETEGRVRDGGPCTDAFAIALKDTVLEFLALHYRWMPKCDNKTESDV